MANRVGRQALVKSALRKIEAKVSAGSDEQATRERCQRCNGQGQFTQSQGSTAAHYPICPTCFGLGQVWGDNRLAYSELIARHARDLVLLVHGECVSAFLAAGISDEERQRRARSMDEVTRLVSSLPNVVQYVQAFESLRASPAFLHPRSRAANHARFNALWSLTRVRRQRL